MAVVLDTVQLDPRDREDAIRATMGAICLPVSTRCDPPSPPAQVHARIHFWELGGASLMRHHSSAIEFVRGTRQARKEDGERFALSVMTGARWRYRQGGADLAVSSRRPHSFGRRRVDHWC
jgi:hypothetical protein